MERSSLPILFSSRYLKIIKRVSDDISLKQYGVLKVHKSIDDGGVRTASGTANTCSGVPIGKIEPFSAVWSQNRGKFK